MSHVGGGSGTLGTTVAPVAGQRSLAGRCCHSRIGWMMYLSVWINNTVVNIERV